MSREARRVGGVRIAMGRERALDGVWRRADVLEYHEKTDVGRGSVACILNMTQRRWGLRGGGSLIFT